VRGVGRTPEVQNREPRCSFPVIRLPDHSWRNTAPCDTVAGMPPAVYSYTVRTVIETKVLTAESPQDAARQAADPLTHAIATVPAAVMVSIEAHRDRP
jgi:hypothetical protein